MREYKIDATNKPLGRLASEIAIILQGKDSPDYQPNKVADVKVIVENVSKMKITGKKLEQKVYRHHTGYIGHLKETPMKDVFEKNPAEVLKKAVLGMLPKNSLRSKRIKNLKIYA
ncbi:MAG TPA: 50S ribosomal protein L13 [Candidatus Paceibacterota bacterium]|nr:50S ribosomal protein L13 [Candidatus Paceibacterota bacterium]HOL53872.1 50S ribosomal protein L13 [Candidatus Paceibacterota bacterium]HON21845.1 50S ribosomal protein L13 [Candidatus Paceibacterota bacterium]HOV88532.1 50S ribosomal protein L13 [Candidatus Paceibacterota bacterium]HPP16789.1 50S ribosomal protein L13 [Candidatus Paceibacterota bacterium]